VDCDDSAKVGSRGKAAALTLGQGTAQLHNYCGQVVHTKQHIVVLVSKQER